MSFSDLCGYVLVVVLGLLFAVVYYLWKLIELLALVLAEALCILFLPVDAFFDHMFLISNIVSVALDALFLYIPLVDEDIKCLVLDNTLKKVVIILRTLSDLRFLLRIAVRFHNRIPDGKQISASRLAIEFFAVLPIPQVLGAFWYYFSILREINCWENACRNQNGCEFSISCNDRSFKNITLINNLCSINQPEATMFDFGIFLEALQSGIQGSTNFPQKFLQCFSWGLRNLSSFASNLNTSTYGWETLFVVLISISGLILFIYLLGHMQTFMQAIKKSDRIQQKMKTIMEPKIRSLLSDYGLPRDMESDIKSRIESKLEQDEDVNAENIYPTLNSDLKKEIKRHLFLDKLNKIPKLKDMEGAFLDLVCEYLEPMMYNESSYIIREGEPVDKMFFITRGIAMTYTTNNGGSLTVQLEKEKDYLYGEELLSWAAAPSSKLSNLPISTITVKSLGKVQVFALNAAEFKDVVSRFSSYFNTDGTPIEIVVDSNSSDIRASRWGHVSKRAQGYESC